MWLYNGEILSQHISTLLKPIHSLLSTQNSKPQETIMAGHLGRLKSDSRFVRSFGSFSFCAKKTQFGNIRVYFSLAVRRRSLSSIVHDSPGSPGPESGGFPLTLWGSPSGDLALECWLSGEQLPRELEPPTVPVPEQKMFHSVAHNN